MQGAKSMNDLTTFHADSLPSLIDRASRALASARDSGEVLEARDMATVAYDAAKTAGRMARAKRAHDDVLVAVYNAQADALKIEFRAKMRLADEYDDAQDRGEVATGNRTNDFGVVGDNAKPATAADLGLRRDQIHEARQIRDAERAEPGLAARAITAMVDRGEEPTRAAVRRELTPKPKPQMAREPLWVWGRVKDFDRDGIMAISPMVLAAGMTAEMRQDMRAQLPAVIEYLTKLEKSV